MNPHQDCCVSEGLDRPAMALPLEIPHDDAVGNLDAYLRDFPIESAYALHHKFIRTYRESTRLGEPDEFKLQRCKHVRVVIEVRDGILEPPVNDANVAPLCDQPLPHHEIRDNPDYYICASCKMIHLRHPLHR